MMQFLFLALVFLAGTFIGPPLLGAIGIGRRG